MPTEEYSRGGPSSSMHAPGYDFHAPEFVEWWLQSLYLLPFEQQVAIAHSLKDSVQIPEVHAEVDLFLQRYGAGPLAAHANHVESVQAASASRETPGEALLGSLALIWRDRPALIWIGGLAALVLVVRGVKFVLGLFGIQ